MTPEQLKASILQYAIQGKLVEQRPEEGTAEELYQQIQKEKQKLIKEGKIKKEKPLAEITDEEVPFDIPESWKWVRLGEICTKIVDGDHNPPVGLNNKTEYIMLSATNINYDSIVELDKVRFLSKEIYEEEHQRTKVEVDDIFFTIVGSMGRSCVYKGGYNLCFQRSVSVITTRVYPEYLKRVLDSPYIQTFMFSNATGTAQKGFYLKQVENLIVPVPPIKEQHRIVARIEELLPYVDRYAEAYEKLEQFNAKFPEDMKKSILQYAIQGKLVEQRPEEGTAEELYQQIQKEKQKLIKEGKIKKEKPLPEITEDEIPFEIPESWKWVRLSELGVFSSGKTPTMGEKEYWENGTVSWITSKDMKSKYLSKSEMFITEKAASEMRLYPKGTMLMVVRSGILKRLLPIAILKEDSTINQDIKAFSVHLPELVEYIYIVLKGMENRILHEYRKQVTTVDSLKFDEFQNIPIPLAPLKEQWRIISRIEEMLPYCDQLAK